MSTSGRPPPREPLLWERGSRTSRKSSHGVPAYGFYCVSRNSPPLCPEAACILTQEAGLWLWALRPRVCDVCAQASWRVCGCVCLCMLTAQLLSHVQLCDPTDGTCPAPLSMGFSRQWVAIPFSRDRPDSGIEPASPALQADSLPLSHQGSPKSTIQFKKPQ